MIKSCCVTGHRDIPVDRVQHVKEELQKEILLAIQDGFTHFISGMADGVDLYFAEIVAEIKTKNAAITLEAAIPYRKRIQTPNKTFQRLYAVCDKENISAEVYSKNCYMLRNMYMVGQSERVIAVSDGRETGGTAFTIRYVKTRGIEVHIIHI